MTAQDYSVTFGYGAVDGVYYTASKPHRGNDRPCPTGTTITIGSTVIGLTGSTGLASGPHLHTQAGRDEWAQQTIDPTPYEFKPGIVIRTGFADQWGYYVCVKTGDVYVYYCHLSAIRVADGTEINGSSSQGGLMTPQFINNGYLIAFGRKASQDEIDHHMKNSTPQTFTDGLVSSPDRFKPEDARAQIKTLQDQLAAKPSTSSPSNPADAADAAKFRQIKEALK